MTAPHRVLVLFAHPAVQKSRLNVRLAAAACGAPGVTFHDLYETYPDFNIDVPAEQARLEAHEVIVLQHPFLWYSGPALLKEWLDLVLERGWAYGPGGDRLRGKLLLSAITTGGAESAYARDGHNRFTMRELLAPFDQTAHLCGMTYLPPFVVHGSTHLRDAAAIDAAAGDYRRVLLALADRRIVPGRVQGWPRLNADLDALDLAP